MSNVETLNEKVAGLQAKIDVLRGEMSAAMSEIMSIKSKEIIKSILDAYGLKGKEAVLSWQFYPEGDDEGGVDYYAENLKLHIDDEEIDMYDHVIEVKSKWSDRYYETDLDEYLRDEFLDRDLRDKLHSDGVEQLVIDISENGEDN